MALVGGDSVENLAEVPGVIGADGLQVRGSCERMRRDWCQASPGSRVKSFCGYLVAEESNCRRGGTVQGATSGGRLYHPMHTDGVIRGDFDE